MPDAAASTPATVLGRRAGTTALEQDFLNDRPRFGQ